VQANICPPRNFRKIHHLTSAYRVGLLALDTLARRVHEPNQAKYSRNPPFREEIQWLLRVSKKLGMLFDYYIHKNKRIDNIE